MGRRVASIDSSGKVTRYEYDALNRLTDVVQVVNASDSVPVEIRTEYGYDEAGRLIWGEDADNRRTSYEYDKNGRRAAVELPLTQRSTTTYDAVGNVYTTTDFNGDSISYRYDEQNRLISKEFASGSGTSPVTFTYTPTGLVDKIVDGRGTTSFKYDERHRLISRIDPNGPYLASGKRIEYEYDAAGNRTKVITPSGSVTYTYDEQNRLKTVTSSQGITTYFYDAVGNLERTQLPNGVVETREYDELNRLKLVKNSKDGVVLSSFDYSLDLVGHRRVVTEQNGRRVNYEYDDLYRLTKETIFNASGSVERTIEYTYDKVGNRLSKNDSVEGVTTYTYDDNDRLLQEELRRNNVLVKLIEYRYDANGNTIRKIENGSQETVYAWNKENRLVGVTKPNGDVISYEYDTDGVRVSSTVNGVKTEFLVDKNLPYAQVLEERVNNGLTASYVYGNDLISQRRGGADSFYLVDGLGSTRGLVNASGVVTDAYTYDAFGNLIASTGGTVNNYRFAGEQFDPNLGDYYLRQRYYDSDTGRFTRRDSYEGRIFDPVSRHKYLYANANPVNFIDPTGLYTLAEAQAANSIRDILAGAQIDAGSHLISATLRGGNYGIENFFIDVALNLFLSLAQNALSFAIIGRGSSSGGSGITSGQNFENFADDTVRVYRVESETNARILVSEIGEVVVQGDGVLFLNFGQRARSEEFLKTRLLQYPDTPSQIKSFEVAKSYVDELRATAVKERNSRRIRANRDKPIMVDVKQAPDQYGLRTQEQIDRLRSVIIQGTGRVEP